MTAAPIPGWKPYVLPFLAFLGFLGLSEGIAWLGGDSGVFWFEEPKYWVFPLQTVVCAALLIWYWRQYAWRPVRWIWGLVGGLTVFAIWISPQWLLGIPERTDGFDPGIFAGDPLFYWTTLVARLMRLIVVVPLVEELFWRGFLMRYLIKEDFRLVRVGAFTPFSFFAVAVAFMLVHSMPDWPAAFISGLIFGWVTVVTRSLFAVVLSHAVANAALGAYILQTKQWGFW